MTFAVPAPSRWRASTTLSVGISISIACGLSPRDLHAAPADEASSEPSVEAPAEPADAAADAEASESADADIPEPADADIPEPTDAPRDEAPDPSSPDSVDGDLGAIDDRPEQPDPEPGEIIRPPRIDGPYVGALAFGSASFASVLNLDTPKPFVGGGGYIQAGDAVFPWMSIGIAAGGQAGAAGNQRLFAGGLLVEFGFIPMPRHPLSIRVGFGFGGGSVREAGVAARAGFGGAMFKGSLRYDFFPLAAKQRPDRGGGWSIGPELGWLGATPAGKGQPFVNTVILGVSTAFYFGS